MKKLLMGSMIATMTLLSFSGCAPKGYSESAVGSTMKVEPGIVQSVRQVQINNKGVGNTLGTVVGAVAGGVAGSTVGGGAGQTVATVAGTAIGGVVGGIAGDSMDNQYGQEVVVKLDSGRTVATVLRINGASAMLQAGQAVNVFIAADGSISNVVPR